MIGFIFKKIVGSKNDREVKKLRPLVARINEIEASLQKLSDEDLRAKTAELPDHDALFAKTIEKIIFQHL